MARITAKSFLDSCHKKGFGVDVKKEHNFMRQQLGGGLRAIENNMSAKIRCRRFLCYMSGPAIFAFSHGNCKTIDCLTLKNNISETRKIIENSRHLKIKSNICCPQNISRASV